MSNWASLYYSYASGMTDYIARHNSNYSRIETCLNYLYALTGGAPTLLDVPYGLRQIFDRRGVIGKGSYKPTAATLSAPDYNLTVAGGAYWYPTDSYRYKDASTTISMSGRSTDTYYINIDAAGEPSVSDTPGTSTTWQFAYNSGTHVVSAVALYTGVNILFDGDDYADCLTSTELAATYESLAERFEAIEVLLGTMISAGIADYYAEDALSHSGLDFAYKAGKVRNDNVIWETVADTITLADDTTNYIELDPSDGTVSTNTTDFTTALIPLFTVVTASGAIDTVTDERTWAAMGGGGGGGHTQNTDVGTTSEEFKLLMGVVGAPGIDAYLKVERGTSADVAIRWNETGDYWEYTNDGTNYQRLGAPDVDLGAQEINKYVPLAVVEKVFEDLARDDSSDWESVDLSTYITALRGATAVQLLVQFWDDTPASGVNVQLKPGSYVGIPPTNVWTVWDAQYDLTPMIIDVPDPPAIELYVNASGTGTANVRVYLVGYYEKIIGVGTQYKEETFSDIDVAASSAVETDVTAIMNRGLVNYLKVEETGGLVSGTYDIAFYAKDTFLEADLLYKAESIDPAGDYQDWIPWFCRDADDTSEIHVKITNGDAGAQGTYVITVKFEQFA